MTRTKSDEMIAEELAKELYGEDCFSATNDLQEAAIGFLRGFGVGLSHGRARSAKLVAALTRIMVEATKGDGTTTECEISALADEALAAHHESETTNPQPNQAQEE